MTQKKLFCFGYGYTANYLGHALSEQGDWAIGGTTRESERRDEMRARGINAHLFDYHVPLPDPKLVLDGVTHLLISTPPDDDGDPAFLAHGHDIFNLPSLEWIGYLSTTGVYGDRDGEWVDETTEIRPSTQRGSRRASAENQWLSLLESHGLPTHVFRLAGIYGPGRSALDSIRAGIARRIDKPGHTFSRIHVEDIVQIVMASMMQPHPGSIYNVVDDLPAPSHEVIEYASQLMGRPSLPLVPFEKADLAPITMSFYSDNRRVKNDKIKQELGISLKYPDYKTGLQGCMEAENYAISMFSNT